jgi:hypothetical protein
MSKSKLISKLIKNNQLIKYKVINNEIKVSENKSIKHISVYKSPNEIGLFIKLKELKINDDEINVSFNYLENNSIKHISTYEIPYGIGVFIKFKNLFLK